MSRERITEANDSAVIPLSNDMLEHLGVNVGDEVDVSIVGRTLILRPLEEAERAEKLDAATNAVIERRRSAYEELARGTGVKRVPFLFLRKQEVLDIHTRLIHAFGGLDGLRDEGALDLESALVAAENREHYEQADLAVCAARTLTI